MNAVKEIISGFLSPLPVTPDNKRKQAPPLPSTPSGISNSPVVGPLHFSKQGGKRKSLKRKNKKNNKTKRR